MDLIELYKLFGATFGFLATALAVWDRFFRYRPILSITAEPHLGGTDPSPLLRIKNPAPFDLMIDRVVSSSPYYRVDSVATLMGTISGAMGVVLPILLAPQEERLLRIAENTIHGVAGKDVAGSIRFTVYWVRSDHPLLSPFPARLWTSGADIERRKLAIRHWAEEQRQKEMDAVP
jgi:hypothetical protein